MNINVNIIERKKNCRKNINITSTDDNIFLNKLFIFCKLNGP